MTWALLAAGLFWLAVMALAMALGRAAKRGDRMWEDK